MKVSLIAAVAKNMGIGKDNDLLWRLPADVKFFKDTTMGHVVITGRKNYESIPEKYRPLSGRTNIVMTRGDKTYAGCKMAHSLEEALDIAREMGEDEAFIIGGGYVFQEAMDKGLADLLYITWVDSEPEADVFFPEFNTDEWVKTMDEHHTSDEKNAYNYSFCVYEKA